MRVCVCEGTCGVEGVCVEDMYVLCVEDMYVWCVEGQCVYVCVWNVQY